MREHVIATELIRLVKAECTVSDIFTPIEVAAWSDTVVLRPYGLVSLDEHLDAEEELARVRKEVAFLQGELAEREKEMDALRNRAVRSAEMKSHHHI